MRLFGAEKTKRLGGTTVCCRDGVVRVSSPDVFSVRGGRWQAFLERVLSLPDIESVEVDRLAGTAEIRQVSQTARLAGFLERLSAALAAPSPEETEASVSKLHSYLAGRSRFRLFRRGPSLSTWEIVHESPGRLRVRDAELRNSPAAAQRIESDLRLQKGIRDISISSYTGSVVIHYDAALADRGAILACLDESARVGGMIACESLPRPKQWLSANATLALAAAGTLLYPPLLPVSAVVLVASNIGTFQNAWRQICRRQVSLPLLHTAIVGATLASGGFLASSLMNWLLVYWQDRRTRLTEAGRQVLSSSVCLPRASAWVVRDGVELETRVEKLQRGDVVAVREGDLIPADGRIVSGSAVLEEHLVVGMNRLVCLAAGDGVHEGSRVVEGELRIEVVRSGEATIATTIGRTLTAAASVDSNGNASAPPEFAERAVSPVLMTAGLGLLVGDATVAAAVLRPDYATGPAIYGSLTLIDQLRACFDEGIVVRRPAAFDRMADADLFLFDHDRLLEARLVQLEDVHVAGEWSAREILEYAACGMSALNDPRRRAVTAANLLNGGIGRHLRITYRAGGIEYALLGREIRIEGLARADAQGFSPLTVFINGVRAGSLTFCQGSGCSAAAAIHELRTQGGLRVGLVSSAPAAEAKQLATALGVDEVHLCPTVEAKADLICLLRTDGRRVVFVGDCHNNAAAAAAANLGVNSSPDPAWMADPSGVWLVQPEFERLVQLREMAQAMRRDARFEQGLVLIPNVVCIAGAFFFGFTSLIAVILSNLGTYSVYSRTRTTLRRTERRLLERRSRQENDSSGPANGRAPRRLTLRAS
jgi:cation transport ATPase